MQECNTGKIVGINGNLVSVKFDTAVTQNEVAYAILGDIKLKCEVIRVRGERCDLQIFEDARGLQIGDLIEFTGELLSVTLGPGLLAQVYDGLQNPLNDLAEKSGFFLERGVYLPPLKADSEWDLTPIAKAGDKVNAGDKLACVKEGVFDHYIMAPFTLDATAEVVEVKAAGTYKLSDTIAIIKTATGEIVELDMTQKWPVKIPIDCFKEKLLPVDTMITACRSIDTFFPVAVGGTFCTPGPFGAGKTVLQHGLSKYAEADVVIIAACGERAGEVVEVLREFPHLEDPRTGRSIMDRSIIICNTSSMPVAAREASVYTAVTLAEYYRQMGLNCLLLADSTSRWAQALREMSGRLEEIPGEEAFPAYLESLIAGFYERAGLVELNDGTRGSVTIGGSVSPAGGNFEEPVTQATLKVVGAFLALDRERANARRYPSIHPLDSWSHYKSHVDTDKIEDARALLKRGNEVNQMMKVIGEDGTSDIDFLIYLKAELLDYVYLQQNSFDPVDACCTAPQQKYLFDKVKYVLAGDFTFEDKDVARRYFIELRQTIIDWNGTPYETEEFNQREQDVDAKIKERINA